MPTPSSSDSGHHILSVQQRGDLYRVIVRGTSRLARNANGTPVDGGGHPTSGRAWHQVRAITTANIAAGRIQPPCR